MDNWGADDVIAVILAVFLASFTLLLLAAKIVEMAMKFNCGVYW